MHNSQAQIGLGGTQLTGPIEPGMIIKHQINHKKIDALAWEIELDLEFLTNKQDYLDRMGVKESM